MALLSVCSWLKGILLIPKCYKSLVSLISLLFLCQLVLLVYLLYEPRPSTAHQNNQRSVLDSQRTDLPPTRHPLDIDFYDHHQHLIAWTHNDSLDADLDRKQLIDEAFAKKPLKCGALNRDALSAQQRSKTKECKEAIAKMSCLLENNALFPVSLPRYCPLQGSGYMKYLGCYKDDLTNRDLSGPKATADENSHSYCTNLCLASGYNYAGVQYGHECWCGDKYGAHGELDDIRCQEYLCPGNHSQSCGGLFSQRIFSTGYGSRPSGEVTPYIAPQVLNSDTAGMVRILFMLTWNGRALRQVKRLFKRIYHVNHYYYIHVDSREEYMYREVLELAKEYDNVRVVRRRLATIWGGSSLLQMLLQTMREALDMTDWHWDFYLNLSESDYPVKSLEQLTAFLTANRYKNFLKSHGSNTPMFIRKQGLIRTFYECDYHLWRVGNRTLPTGIRVDGGSDWICLNRQFISYVVNTNDELLEGLQRYYRFAILPAESFFHTVLQNSKHCESFVDNNLHQTNWNRKRGCLCQYKHIVDWCGCSPVDYTDSPSDLTKLKNTQEAQIFFARKFEAVVNSNIINLLDEWVTGKRYPDGYTGLDHYWQSVYDIQDSWKAAEDIQYTFYTAFARIAARKLAETNDNCHLQTQEIQQAHLLNVKDKFNSLLIQVEGQLSNGQAAVWEVKTTPVDTFKLIKPLGPISRLKHIMIGSVFDKKERIFRDPGRFLGSHSSNVTVVQVWEGGEEVTVDLHIVNPLGQVSYTTQVSIPQGNQVMSVSQVDLSNPIIPGKWKAKISYQDSLVAEASFLVLPEVFHRRKIKDISGLEFSTDAYVNELQENKLDLNGQYESPKDLRHLVSLSRDDLLLSLDAMVEEFWTPDTVCAVNFESMCPLISACHTTDWSSHSPDPKSHIGAIDHSNGKITHLH